MEQAVFRFHSVEVIIQSASSEVLENVRHDFRFFLKTKLAEEASALRVTVLPASSKPPGWRRLWRGRRSEIFFSPPGEQRICFFKNAWVSYRYADRRATIYCDDSDKAYETLYFTLLSYVGERLDESGLHRIHGLGVRVWGRGMICLGQSGAGKSTLALRLLREKWVQLLSDDTPVVARKGEMRAFPERIALREKPPRALGKVRQFRRAEYGEKYVLGAEWFAERVIPRARVDWLLLLERGGGERSRLVKLPKHQAIWPLAKWLVAGYETPQIWELYLRLDLQDVIKKTKILASRALAAWDLLKEARVGRLELSQSPEEASRALLFLSRSLDAQFDRCVSTKN